jgi:hypothetical protein
MKGFAIGLATAAWVGTATLSYVLHDHDHGAGPTGGVAVTSNIAGAAGARAQGKVPRLERSTVTARVIAAAHDAR